ncbi:MAG: wax ester/triacylglycerol synthase family O-acyltransferase [Candidatus Binatia bacterium]
MPRYAYDQLTFLDNSFLIMEAPNAPMHVAATATFEGGNLIGRDGALDIDAIRAYVASRLHLIPRYRQRLATLPLQGRPVWVDDPHFNIHYHVRHTALPKPGDERQLKRLAARIMAQHLDRSKPLWETWFVEGLAGGDRFAMISKVHHCMVDGMSSVDLLSVLLQLAPSDEIKEAPEWIPRPAPTVMDLAAETAEQLSTLPRTLGDTVRRTVRDAQDPRSDLRARLRAFRDAVTDTVRTVSPTPLNRPIGPHRRFDWHRMPLGEIKAVKNALGGTLNDVVLATVERRHPPLPQAPPRRRHRPRLPRHGPGQRAQRRRARHARQPRLGLDGAAAARRGRSVPGPDPHPRDHRAPQGVEGSDGRRGAGPGRRVDAVDPALLGSRMMTRALPFNLVVTNVPGPQLPLYLLSARMLDNYGLIPLTDYLCLGIVLFSYDGALCWGFTCDWDLVPDLHDFVRDVQAAFAALQAAAAAAPPAPAKRAARRVGKARKGPQRRPTRSRAG